MPTLRIREHIVGSPKREHLSISSGDPFRTLGVTRPAARRLREPSGRSKYTAHDPIAPKSPNGSNSPGHIDGLRSTSMVAMSPPISPSSPISRRLAPGGPASHAGPQKRWFTHRNCQNRRMAHDLPRKGPAHNSGPEPRDRTMPRCTLPVLTANEPAIIPIARRQQMFCSIQGPPADDAFGHCPWTVKAQRAIVSCH